MAMFFGETEYRIDEKGRVPVPAKFRQELRGEGIVLTRGAEKCITAYPMSEWKKLSDNIGKGQLPPSKMRKLMRALFSTATSVKTDGQGRIILPANLRQYAEIDEEVVIVGANDYFELWNKGNWDAEKISSQEEAWQIIESMERF